MRKRALALLEPTALAVVLLVAVVSAAMVVGRMHVHGPHASHCHMHGGLPAHCH